MQNSHSLMVGIDRKRGRRKSGRLVHRLGDGGGGGADCRVRSEGLQPPVDVHL
jgi:hypothetical protein